MKEQRKFLLAAVAGILLAGMSLPAIAAQVFEPNVVISDGKEGRPWAKWSQPIKEHPVKQVIAVLRRESGGDDTFVNLRFGDGGQAFEGGRRVHLKSNKKQKVVWQVHNEEPNGRPLVMNAYHGTVRVLGVSIHYGKK